jgi:uncharacterized protein (DUF2235 family)
VVCETEPQRRGQKLPTLGQLAADLTGTALRLRNTNRLLPRSQVEKAYARLPVSRPGDVQDLQGPSYLYAILTDPRVPATSIFAVTAPSRRDHHMAIDDATAAKPQTATEPGTRPADERKVPRRRLVVCCDGTWNRADQKNITNIEKIARSVQIDLDACGGCVQQVEYIAGVGGAGYTADRILGGWLGAGVFSNVRAAYRFLSLNYEEGHDIFLFGFSRGAYTARSVAGMIGSVGLITREALLGNRLAEALDRYKNWPADPTDDDKAAREKFRRECCHPDLEISFLGVFDTVGSLGVPSVIHAEHQFHNITLGKRVRVARQALAINERRRPFTPCLWAVPKSASPKSTVTSSDGQTREVERVKQVWFPGVHSDIGGGYNRSGLSDTALKWMTDEAAEAGLVFDHSVLDQYLNVGQPAVLHNTLNPMYKVANLYETVIRRPEVLKDSFVDGWRNLTPSPGSQAVEPDQDPTDTTMPVLLASSGRRLYGRDAPVAIDEDHERDEKYEPPNLTAYLRQHEEPDQDEGVVALPETAVPPSGLRPERAQG